MQDSVSPPLSVVSGALGFGFAVVPEPPRAIRRTWLDTFDWRLFRAGLTLEHLGDGQGGELCLATIAGRQVARTPAVGLAWPGRPAGGVLGVLGEQLAPVLGVRALLPMAETRGSLRRLRLLNRDEKTVVRAVVEETSVLWPAPGRLSSRVSLTPVRGYDRQAQLARRVLVRSAGIVASPTSQFEEALASVGRWPGDYTGKVEVTLAGSATASSAVANVLLRVLDVLAANVDGVVRDLDSEFLHDLRIAVRRTRSGLALAGDALPDGLVARFGGEFKWLGQLTTPVRDLDVCLEGLAASVSDIGAGQAGAFGPFRGYLERCRGAARPELLAGLQSPRFAALLTDWRAALDDVPAQSLEGERSVAELAAARITRGYKRIVKPGTAITPTSAAEDLHELRKRCKELRYLLEYFASLHPPAPHRAMIKELKSLQDCLGRFQDSQFQRQAIASLADQMAGELTVPAATRRAMERLSARLDAQQAEARSEFASRFDRFASPKTVALVGALTERRSR